VDDQLDGPTLAVLAAGGTRLIALRSAGFNNVDLASAEKLKMTVMRVPAYSPEAVAEHAVALMLALNRNIHHAYNRVREGNFDLSGLVGFNLADKTVGIVGTGKIGTALAHIMKGFGCRLVGYDTYNNPACLALDMKYVDLPFLLAEADIVSLHCPLTPETAHLINCTRCSRIFWRPRSRRRHVWQSSCSIRALPASSDPLTWSRSFVATSTSRNIRWKRQPRQRRPDRPRRRFGPQEALVIQRGGEGLATQTAFNGIVDPEAVR